MSENSARIPFNADIKNDGNAIFNVAGIPIPYNLFNNLKSGFNDFLSIFTGIGLAKYTII